MIYLLVIITKCASWGQVSARYIQMMKLHRTCLGPVATQRGRFAETCRGSFITNWYHPNALRLRFLEVNIGLANCLLTPIILLDLQFSGGGEADTDRQLEEG